MPPFGVIKKTLLSSYVVFPGFGFDHGFSIYAVLPSKCKKYKKSQKQANKKRHAAPARPKQTERGANERTREKRERVMNEAAARKEEHGRKGVTKRTKGSGKGRKRTGKNRSARRGNEKRAFANSLRRTGC